MAVSHAMLRQQIFESQLALDFPEILEIVQRAKSPNQALKWAKREGFDSQKLTLCRLLAKAVKTAKNLGVNQVIVFQKITKMENIMNSSAVVSQTVKTGDSIPSCLEMPVYIRRKEVRTVLNSKSEYFGLPEEEYGPMVIAQWLDTYDQLGIKADFTDIVSGIKKIDNFVPILIPANLTDQEFFEGLRKLLNSHGGLCQIWTKTGNPAYLDSFQGRVRPQNKTHVVWTAANETEFIDPGNRLTGTDVHDNAVDMTYLSDVINGALNNGCILGEGMAFFSWLFTQRVSWINFYPMLFCVDTHTSTGRIPIINVGRGKNFNIMFSPENVMADEMSSEYNDLPGTIMSVYQLKK
ncbi:MAG: hypothetical protein UT64_C0063G0003 [Candidatus Falkowbacteria bacterium GW2011_GWF2_39_8]|uniref:Uncharacterized protein n=1 Tax=Candidatus Falkowbacteria bacterium GW2011_GWF2_39_8 TaxID=1618642 RepID=A0A0G0PTW2_9BACT|nr:MAG: hypothetical protein UT64_C0063G0003 [Candidatus Falkowbacteria bacterium GW2011_GWF2_39_8]